MNTPLSIGLIGIGGMGLAHLSALAELEAAGQVRLVAVADPAAEKLAPQIAGMKARGVPWYPAYETMLEQEKLDAVVIATPIYFHAEMARKCLEHGIFIYLEKPPVPLIQQLEELIKIDRDDRVHLVFQMISSEFIQQLKKSVIEGELGQIKEIRACASWPRTDSYYDRNNWAGKMVHSHRAVFDGPATNALAHLIHNAMFLAGESQQEFSSLDQVQAELYRVRPIESYDLACLRGTFPSGIEFVAALTHATRKPRPFRLRIQGTKGWAEISEDGSLMESSCARQVCAKPFDDAFRNSYQSFVTAAKAGKGQRVRPVTGLKDARGYVKATNGALLSSGGIFTIDEAYSEVYGVEGDRGYDLPDLTGFIDRCFCEGLLFSELGATWAKPTSVVRIQDLSSLDIHEFVAPKGFCSPLEA